MESLTFVYVLHVRLEFEIKSSLDGIHPASDGSLAGDKKIVIPVFLEETDPGPTGTEKMHLIGKLPLVACWLMQEKKLAYLTWERNGKTSIQNKNPTGNPLPQTTRSEMYLQYGTGLCMYVCMHACILDAGSLFPGLRSWETVQW